MIPRRVPQTALATDMCCSCQSCFALFIYWREKKNHGTLHSPLLLFPHYRLSIISNMRTLRVTFFAVILFLSTVALSSMFFRLRPFSSLDSITPWFSLVSACTVWMQSRYLLLFLMPCDCCSWPLYLQTPHIRNLPVCSNTCVSFPRMILLS